MAIAKTEEEMVTKSIYIKRTLYEQLQYASGQFGVSLILAQLAEKWLDNKIEISIKPIVREGE